MHVFRRLLPAAACLVALASASSPASAQALRMTPGLWEQTVSMKSGSGELEAKQAEAQARLAAMPPEQRAMVENMMKSRGVQMGPKGTTLRICISKEMSEREPTPPKESRCEHQQVARNGSSVTYKFTCEGRDGNPPTTGEGTFQMTSSTSYTGTSIVNTTVHGKPERMENTVTGKYLGSDCGDIKPVQVPAR